MADDPTDDAPTIPARFLSISEFADVFGLGKRTVYDLIQREVIPAIPLGRRRLIPAVVVDMLEAAALANFDAEAAIREINDAQRRDPSGGG